MSLYDRFDAVAAKLLATDKFGGAATIHRSTSVYDRVTDTNVKSEASISCTGVIGRRKIANDDGIKRIETVFKTNEKVEIGDRVVIGSKTYTVLSVEEIAPIGDAIVWQAVVK